MARKASIGDIFEVSTSRGFGYIQLTHRHPEYRELIRAIGGLFKTRPNDVTSLAARPTIFKVFYPVDRAKKDLIEWVGNAPVPEADKHFPTIRCRGLPDPKTGEFDWAIWDGSGYRPIKKKLSTHERALPIRQHVNHGMLVHYVESQWDGLVLPGGEVYQWRKKDGQGDASNEREGQEGTRARKK